MGHGLHMRRALNGALPGALPVGDSLLTTSGFGVVVRNEVRMGLGDLRKLCGEDTRRALFDYSNRLFERLGCQDYARFDFRTDEDGEIKLLEVNPNPGWCWDGKLNFMAGFAGMRYSDLLGTILDAAQERILAAAKNPQSNGASRQPSVAAMQI